MTDSAQDTPRLRADARRNRRLILAAAREAFAEHGVEVPLEEIARRAGVGIATLYRRFPDRNSLIHGVAVDNMTEFGREAERAEAEEPDPWQALTRVLHFTVARKVGLLLPLVQSQLRDELSERAELWERRSETVRRLQHLLTAAQRQGLARPDIGLGDLALGVVKLSRPMPNMSPEFNDQVTRRQLALFLDGMQATSTARRTSLAPWSIDEVDRQAGV